MSAIAHPLVDLTIQDKASGKPLHFVWKKAYQQVFEEVKEQLLMSTPLLHPPDWKKAF